MLKRIGEYFALERPVQGASGVKNEIGLFTGVIAGSLCRWGLHYVQTGQPDYAGLLIGLIAGIVTFPEIYRRAGMKKSEGSLVKWCVAFQGGFFWPALFDTVSQSF